MMMSSKPSSLTSPSAPTDLPAYEPVGPAKAKPLAPSSNDNSTIAGKSPARTDGAQTAGYRAVSIQTAAHCNPLLVAFTLSPLLRPQSAAKKIAAFCLKSRD